MKKIIYIIILLFLIIIPSLTLATTFDYFIDEDNSSVVWIKLNISVGQTQNISLTNSGSYQATSPDDLFIEYLNFSTDILEGGDIGASYTYYYYYDLPFDLVDNFTIEYRTKIYNRIPWDIGDGFLSIGVGDTRYNDNGRDNWGFGDRAGRSTVLDRAFVWGYNDGSLSCDTYSALPNLEETSNVWRRNVASIQSRSEIWAGSYYDNYTNSFFLDNVTGCSRGSSNFDSLSLWNYRSNAGSTLTYNDTMDWYSIHSINTLGEINQNISNIKIYNGTINDANITCNTNWCEIIPNKEVNNFVLPIPTNLIGPLRASNGTSELTTYNITTTQSIDINTEAIDTVRFNATIQPTGNASALNGSAYFIQYINTSLNNGCAIFENRQCSEPNGSYNNFSMNKVNNTFFNLTLDDTYLFPAYYPFDAHIMKDATKTPYYIYRNNYLMWEVVNFTTHNNIDLFLALEVGGDNQTDDEPLYIYYCNESYDQSSNPTGTNNCELQQAVLSSNLPSHAHGQTKHYVTGIQPTIQTTQNSTFVFYTEAVNQARGWWINYFTNASYTANEFFTGRYGLMTRDTTNIYDVHLHQSLATDSFNYYVEYQDEDTTKGTSNLTTDYYEIANRPPNTPLINAPCSITHAIDNESNTYIFFNWTNATDPDGDNITYNVSMRSNSSSFVYNIGTTNNSNISIYLNTTDINLHGVFSTKIKTCDPEGLCSDTLSTCTFSNCVPDWNLVDTSCIDGIKTITYTDSHSCNIYNALPPQNGTLEACGGTTGTSGTDPEILLIVALLLFNYFVFWNNKKLNNTSIGNIFVGITTLSTMASTLLLFTGTQFAIIGYVILGFGIFLFIYKMQQGIHIYKHI